MRPFTHFNAGTVKEACKLLAKYDGRAVLNAGGTDLLATLKGENLFEYPEAVINIKTIAGLDEIVESKGTLRIGALAKLSAIVNSPLLNERYPGPCGSSPYSGHAPDPQCGHHRREPLPGCALLVLPVSAPHRRADTLCAQGQGALSCREGRQSVSRPDGRKEMLCRVPLRHGRGAGCPGWADQNCGPGRRKKNSGDGLLQPLGKQSKARRDGDGVEVPSVEEESKQAFLKFTLRKPVDFAIVSVASVITVKAGVCTDARIALGAVAPGPVRARKAEKILVGRPVDEKAAADAAEAALAGAKPLSMNAYKIEIAKTLVKRAILQSREP